MAKATSTPSNRPTKPRSDYPLFPHRDGQWAKRSWGAALSLGRGESTKTKNVKLSLREAENVWDIQKSDLRAGRKPRTRLAVTGALTIRELCNDFMNSQELKIQTSELSQR